MMRRTRIAVIAPLAVVARVGMYLLPGTCSMADDPKQPMLIHNVYFTLKEGTAENTQKLTDACFKYLKDHPGVVFFAAGPLVTELERPVNVRLTKMDQTRFGMAQERKDNHGCPR